MVLSEVQADVMGCVRGHVLPLPCSLALAFARSIHLDPLQEPPKRSGVLLELRLQSLMQGIHKQINNTSRLL